MKKCLSIVMLALSGFALQAQADIDFLTTLTPDEATFIQTYFVTNKNQSAVADYVLTNKKVLFVTGSAASTLGNKSYYLNQLRESSAAGHPISTAIQQLDETERKKYGYDYIITYWVKIKPNLKRLAKKIAKAK